MKHFIHFETGDGCTRFEQCTRRPYPYIERLMPAPRPRFKDDGPTDTPLAFSSCGRRRYEFTGQVVLPNGDMIYSYFEVVE